MREAKTFTPSCIRFGLIMLLVLLIMLLQWPVSAASLNDYLNREKAADEQNKEESNDVIVMFDTETNLTKSNVKKKLSKSARVSGIKVEEVWNFEKEDTSVALVTSDQDANQLAAELAKRNDVKYAEKDFKVHALSVSDDPYSDMQWSLQSNENTPNVESAWKVSTGSDRVVAVVDSGVDYTHPDLRDNLWVNPFREEGLKGKYGYDFVDGDEDPMDENGHGTHIAGIIGACGNNGIGISGVNQKIKIMALRILDEDAMSTLSHEIAAYYYINKAIDLGVPVRVINNSWGGGEYSRIFKEIVEIVGEKGAVSVCAAGNQRETEPMYPINMGSQYIISVGATEQDGQMAQYSARGDWVDVAAPGSSILSTVSFDCYNPGIYGEKQRDVSKWYQNFEGEEYSRLQNLTFFLNGKAMKKEGSIKDGLVYKGDNGKKVEMKIVEDGFRGRSLKMTCTGFEQEDLLCAPLKYRVDDDFDEDENLAPKLSMMTRVSGGEDFNAFLAIAETMDTDDFSIEEVENWDMSGGGLNETDSQWSHLYTEFDNDISAGEDRQFVFVFYAISDSDYTIDIDDVGMSRQDLVGTEVFGKYEYYSGTSIAAAFVSGALALEDAVLEAEEGKKADVNDLINRVIYMAKEEQSLSIKDDKGSLDFRVKPVLPPRIGSIFTDQKDIIITGSAIDTKAEDFSVLITKDGETEEVRGISAEDNSIRFPAQGWINNLIDIEIISNGYSVTKEDIYMVNGKMSYDQTESAMSFDEITTTDGRYIYYFDQETNGFAYYDTENDAIMNWEKIPTSLFGINLYKNQEYSFEIEDMAFLDGSVYAVTTYGAAELTESGDEYAIYDGKTLLLEIDGKKGTCTSHGSVKIGDRKDYAMAAYNGRLYFIGGCRMSSEEGENDIIPSGEVTVYDPADKKWSQGPALPAASRDGKALQSGTRLIYTLGKEDDESGYQPNMVFDGQGWTVSKAGSIEPLAEGFEPAVGITKGGLIYAGMPVMDYGDSFIYNVSEDKYVDTGYSLIQTLSSVVSFVTVTEKKVFAGLEEANDEGEEEEDGIIIVEEGEGYVGEMPIESGFVHIAKSVKGEGEVVGLTTTAPGNNVTLTFSAYPGNHIESIQIDGKKIAVGKDVTEQAYTFQRMTKDATVAVVFAKDVHPDNVIPAGDTDNKNQGSGEIILSANTLTVKGRKVTVKYSGLMKKTKTVKRSKAITVSKAKGKVTYKLKSVSKKKYKTFFKVNSKTGNLTLKKGLKRGTYKLKVAVQAAGIGNKYKAGNRNASVAIVVR